MQLRAGRLSFPAEIGLSVLTSMIAVAATVCIAARHSRVPELALGLALLIVVLAVAQIAGVLYALPVGVVTTGAYDWSFLPPRHNIHATALSALALLTAMAVTAGWLITRIGRHAVAAERARGGLADEQAALRRIATLVASGAAPAEVFAAVADELANLLGADSRLVARLDAPARNTQGPIRGSPSSVPTAGYPRSPRSV